MATWLVSAQQTLPKTPAARYSATFGSTTSLSVTAGMHGLGANLFTVLVYDSATPQDLIEPASITIDASGNVTVTFAVPQTGQIVIE